MTQEHNIGFRFREVAAQSAEHPAIIFEDSQITYHQLWRLVETFAYKMSVLGVGRQSLIGMKSSDTTVVLASALAASCLGARFTLNVDEVRQISEERISHLFATHANSLASDVSAIVIDSSWSPAELSAEVLAAQELSGFSSPDDPFLVVSTSETSGFPRAVILSAKMTENQCTTSGAGLFSAGKQVASAFTPTNRHYLVTLIGALLNQRTLVDSQSIEMLTKNSVDVVVGTKNSLLANFSELQPEAKFNTALVYGELSTTSELGGFLNTFENVVEVLNFAEFGDAFTKSSSYVGDEIISSGSPSLFEFEILENPILSDSGLLRLNVEPSNDAIAPTDPQIASHIRDGWFYPNLTAKILENGVLDYRNANPDLVTIEDRNINAAILDHAIKAVDAVNDAVCFMNPKTDAEKEIFAFVVFGDNASTLQIQQSIKFFMKRQFGKPFVPRIINPIDTIPRLTNGAPDRKYCQQMVLNWGTKKEN